MVACVWIDGRAPKLRHERKSNVGTERQAAHDGKNKTRQDKTDQKEKRGRGRRGQARARQGRARQGRRQAGKDRPTGRAKAGNNDCHHTGSHTLFVSLSSLATRAHLLNPVWCPRPARCQAPNVIARWSPSPGGRVPSAVLVTAATPTSPWFVLTGSHSFIHAVLPGLLGLPRVALALSRRIPHPSLPPQSCLLVYLPATSHIIAARVPFSYSWRSGQPNTIRPSLQPARTYSHLSHAHATSSCLLSHPHPSSFSFSSSSSSSPPYAYAAVAVQHVHPSPAAVRTQTLGTHSQHSYARRIYSTHTKHTSSSSSARQIRRRS